MYVGIRGLNQLGRELRAFGDNLVHGLHYVCAAHGDGTRPVGAHTEEDLSRVAVDDVDVLHGNAEAIGHDLSESGLVSLAVGVRAGEYCHLARRMHANFARLDETRPRTERTGDIR